MSTQNRPTRDRVPGSEAWYKGFNWDKFQDFTLDPWYFGIFVGLFLVLLKEKPYRTSYETMGVT